MEGLQFIIGEAVTVKFYPLCVILPSHVGLLNGPLLDTSKTMESFV